tara:strand:- start:1866 stop:2885 length:1020 start_codon:yes stop_codon:yes gene_type:complete
MLSKRFLIAKQRYLLFIFLICLIVSILLAVTIGSFKISVTDILFGNLDELGKTILFTIRMPRVMLAAIVGASLAISGACLQGLFRNPLADPGLIGVSAGAALGAAFAIVFSSQFISLNFLGPYLIPFSAIIGSASVIIILFIITKGFGYDGVTYMLLAGIAVNAIAGVGIGLLTYISDDSELRSLTFWTMGSFGGVTWPLIIPAVVVILFSIIWIIGLSRKLDLIQLGDVEASRLGINIRRVRFGIIISSAVVVGISVALSGMIGFVGLVVPHLVRILGGVNHIFVLLGSAIFGSILMVISDMMCRVIISPAELPVGLITSGLGSPFFLWLIFKMRSKN